MMPNRFFLGLGTGEYLNEHILGDPCPRIETRQEMLSEAIHIIRELWNGKEYSYDGTYFTVRDARIYTLPEKLHPIYMAASGADSAETAAEIADGLISISSGDEIVKAFKKRGGSEKPCFGSVKVCWAYSMDEAKIPEDSIIGPNPTPYLKAIQSLQENGYDHILYRTRRSDSKG